MRIGLTYDLADEYRALGFSEEAVAEFDRLDTIEALAETLRSLGHDVEPIGQIKALAARLVEGDRWDLVFNIAEGMHGAARESQVPALLDAYEIPYTFSDPLVLGVALHKGIAKMVVRSAGVRTADFAIALCVDDVASVDLAFPIFAKPIAEGTSKGVTPTSIVRNEHELATTTRELLDRFRQPVLLERFLPGRELTVGVVGTAAAAEVLGSLEVHLVGDADAGVYSYRNKKEFDGKVEYTLADPSDLFVRDAERLALAAWVALGCRDGGRVDVRADDQGRPTFIEANPLAGLNPTISDLAILANKRGLTYRDLIARIVASATLRL